VTALAYDPLDYETWPEDQKDFAGTVWRGLHDGDLRPLAAYLRAGHYIDPGLAREIADAIEDVEGGWFKIVAVGKGGRTGPKGLTFDGERNDRKTMIGVWVEKNLRECPRGASAGIYLDAQERFQASRTVVLGALRHVRRSMNYFRENPDRGDPDRWLALQYQIWFGG
jgi:hypothetical protein